MDAAAAPAVTFNFTWIGKKASAEGLGAIFVTGTDTGVGKTVATGLLVRLLRQSGVKALAIKPFCSGSRRDVMDLWRAQDKALSKEEINPFYFARPVAPFAAREHQIRMPEAIKHIRRIERQCDCLLVEGAGGLLAPLGPGKPRCYTARELIRELKCRVLIVARNKLGTINHTCLTVQALGSAPQSNAILLMDNYAPDPSQQSNLRIIRALVAPTPVALCPRLGRLPLAAGNIARNAQRCAPAFRALGLMS